MFVCAGLPNRHSLSWVASPRGTMATLEEALGIGNTKELRPYQRVLTREQARKADALKTSLRRLDGRLKVRWLSGMQSCSVPAETHAFFFLAHPALGSQNERPRGD